MTNLSFIFTCTLKFLDEIILAVASDEASQQLAENEIHKKHKAVTIADKKSFGK